MALKTTIEWATANRINYDLTFRAYIEDGEDFIELNFTDTQECAAITEITGKRHIQDAATLITSGSYGGLAQYSSGVVGFYSFSKTASYSLKEAAREVRGYTLTRTIELRAACKATGALSPPSANSIGGFKTFPHNMVITRPSGSTHLFYLVRDLEEIKSESQGFGDSARVTSSSVTLTLTKPCIVIFGCDFGDPSAGTYRINVYHS